MARGATGTATGPMVVELSDRSMVVVGHAVVEPDHSTSPGMSYLQRI
jgi:hypothetical protein